MEILKEYENIKTQADGNHFQVLKDNEIVFDEKGPWAPMNADKVFLKLRDEVKDSKTVDEMFPFLTKNSKDWTDQDVIDFARTMCDGGACPKNEPAKSQYIEFYKDIAENQGR